LLTFTAEVYPDDLHSPSPMDVTPVRVRLGLTDDRWETVASTRVRIAGNGRIRSQVGDFSVRTDPSNPQWLDAAPHSAAYGRQYRLVAVDARGREHVIRGAEGAVWQDAVTGGYGTVLPARHTIREVRLQTAPVYWVEFRDIYLRSDYPAQTAARGGSEGEAPWDGAGKRLEP